MVQEVREKHGAELFRPSSGDSYLRAPIMRKFVTDSGDEGIEVDYFDNLPLSHGSAASEYLLAPDFLGAWNTTFDTLRVGDWVSGDRVTTPRGYLGARLALTRPDCIPPAGASAPRAAS